MPGEALHAREMVSGLGEAQVRGSSQQNGGMMEQISVQPHDFLSGAGREAPSLPSWNSQSPCPYPHRGLGARQDADGCTVQTEGAPA